MSSIRRRLIVFLALGLLLLFAIGGAVVYQIVKGDVHDAFDRNLESRARALAAGLVVAIDPAKRHEVTQLGLRAMPGGEGSDADRAAARAALLALAEEAFRVRFVLDPSALTAEQDTPERYVIRSRGEVVSDRKGETELPYEREGYVDLELSLSGSTPGRAFTRHVQDVRFADARWSDTWDLIAGNDGRAVTSAEICVAREVATRDGYLRTLRNGLLLAGLVLVLAVALVTYFVVRRGLAPLATLSKQVAALDAHTLDQRLQWAGLPEELQPMVLRLNEALDRIEASVDRERQTAANIAHELRTPLAELMTITELAARWPDDAEIQARAVGDSLAVAQHMTRVVSALLKVARAESADGLSLEALDLVPIVRDAWSGIAGSAGERGQSLETSLPEALDVLSDREVAEAVVATLFKNAVEHAPSGSTIRCEGTQTNGAVALTVANPAPDLSADDVEHVRALFWRKDDVRTPSEHSGLGLFVAAALAQSADIQLVPSLTDGVFSVTLELKAG